MCAQARLMNLDNSKLSLAIKQKGIRVRIPQSKCSVGTELGVCACKEYRLAINGLSMR